MMRSAEINPEGSFETWDPQRVKELKTDNFSDALGHYLLYENTNMRLWELVLLPKERITFRKQKSPYVWVCETGGMTISRQVNGQIFLCDIEEGDTSYFVPNGGNYVRDFENIGDEILKMTIIEFIKEKHPHKLLR